MVLLGSGRVALVRVSSSSSSSSSSFAAFGKRSAFGFPFRGVRFRGNVSCMRTFSAKASGADDEDDDEASDYLSSILTSIKSQVEHGSQEEEIEGVRHAKGGEKLLLRFTCTHTGDCDFDKDDDESRKVAKHISTHAYKTGVVLVKCPCEKLHMVADNLGWFGEEKNIEELLAKAAKESAGNVEVV